MNRVTQQPLLAFIVALGAVASLSLMDALMKGLVIAIGVFATSVWRAMIGVATGAAIYLPRRTGWPPRRTLAIHVARGAIITVMGLAFFWGIARTPLAQAIALTFIAPLVALFLAAVFLNETVGARVIGGSFVAFAGVAVIVAGAAGAHLGPDAVLGSAAILFSALCYAINIVLMRAQAQAARPPEITFFQNVTIAATLLLALPLIGAPAWPEGHWPALIASSLLSTLGLLLFAFAYARGEAGYLSVTEYSAFLWAALLGWLIFGERVSGWTLAGALLIIGGCLIAARRGAAASCEVEIEAVA